MRTMHRCASVNLMMPNMCPSGPMSILLLWVYIGRHVLQYNGFCLDLCLVSVLVLCIECGK